MLETLKSQVESILQEYPEARNSDITLLIRIWTRFYGVEMSISLDRLYELPKQDNVKRIRAKIQNEEGKYLPTELKIALKRGILESEWREFMGYAQPNPNYYVEKTMDEKKEVSKESNILIRCPKCGGAMKKETYHNEMREKPIEKIICLKCGKEL